MRRFSPGHPPSRPPASPAGDEFLDDLLPKTQRMVRRSADGDRGRMPDRPVRRRGDVIEDFLYGPTDPDRRRYACHATSRRINTLLRVLLVLLRAPEAIGCGRRAGPVARMCASRAVRTRVLPIPAPGSSR